MVVSDTAPDDVEDPDGGKHQTEDDQHVRRASRICRLTTGVGGDWLEGGEIESRAWRLPS